MEPCEFVCQAIKRNQEQSTELSSLRYTRFVEDSETAKLWEKEGRDPNDIQALLKLSPVGFNIWTRCREQYVHYHKRPSIFEDDCTEIYRFEDQASPARIIGPGRWCNCEARMEHLSLCEHQLCFDDGQFIIDRFRPHLHRKMGVRTLPRPAFQEDSSESPTLEEFHTSTRTAIYDNCSDFVSAFAAAGDDTEDNLRECETEIFTQDLPADNCRTITTKKKKWTYNEVMNEMKAFAELVDKQTSQSVQDVLMGGFFGMMGAIRTGSFSNTSSLDEVMREYLSSFASANELGTASHDDTSLSQSLSQGDFIRRGAVSNIGRPRTNRLISSLERGKTTGTKDEPNCGFCLQKGHIQGSKCLVYTKYKQYLATPDTVTKLKLSIGNDSVHAVSPCPPAVMAVIHRRESANEAFQGWPCSAKHIIIHRAFYDPDVPHQGTRYSQGPRVGDHLKNIIELSFLSVPGGNEYKDSNGTSIFHCRASDAMQMIDKKVTKKNRLVNKLKMCSV